MVWATTFSVKVFSMHDIGFSVSFTKYGGIASIPYFHSMPFHMTDYLKENPLCANNSEQSQAKNWRWGGVVEIGSSCLDVLFFLWESTASSQAKSVSYLSEPRKRGFILGEAQGESADPEDWALQMLMVPMGGGKKNS